MSNAQATFDRLKKLNVPTERIWGAMCVEKLVHRRIVEVRYLTDEEMKMLGWYEKSLAIFLDDGNYFFASSDDEGNGAGALFTSYDDMPTIPVIGG